MAGWAVTATTPSCSARRSSARPITSLPCWPGGPGGCARWRRACGGPVPGSARGLSRSPMSTCCCMRGGRWTSSPRPTPCGPTGRRSPAEKEPALRQFLLLIGGLRALAEGAHDPRLVLDAYLLRSLAVAGYAPALQECAVCGTPAPAAAAGADAPAAAAGSVPFAIGAGGLLCRNCRVPGAASPSVSTIALMGALLRGDWRYADASERRHRAECSGLVAAYLQWHLEHAIRSLRLVEQAGDAGRARDIQAAP